MRYSQIQARVSGELRRVSSDGHGLRSPLVADIDKQVRGTRDDAAWKRLIDLPHARTILASEGADQATDVAVRGVIVVSPVGDPQISRREERFDKPHPTTGPCEIIFV